MKKLLTLLALRLIIKDDKSLVNVFNTIYSEKYETSNIGVVKKPKTKQDELLESLNYLKSKKKKTAKDRESIGILEAVIRNVK
jgi:hypothetical protein